MEKKDTGPSQEYLEVEMVKNDKYRNSDSLTGKQSNLQSYTAEGGISSVHQNIRTVSNKRDYEKRIDFGYGEVEQSLEEP